MKLLLAFVLPCSFYCGNTGSEPNDEISAIIDLDRQLGEEQNALQPLPSYFVLTNMAKQKAELSADVSQACERVNHLIGSIHEKITVASKSRSLSCNDVPSLEQVDRMFQEISYWRSVLGARYNLLEFRGKIRKKLARSESPGKELSDIVKRIKSLARQASKELYSDEDRKQVNHEIILLRDELLQYQSFLDASVIAPIQKIMGVQNLSAARETFLLASRAYVAIARACAWEAESNFRSYPPGRIRNSTEALPGGYHSLTRCLNQTPLRLIEPQHSRPGAHASALVRSGQALANRMLAPIFSKKHKVFRENCERKSGFAALKRLPGRKQEVDAQARKGKGDLFFTLTFFLLN